MKKALVLLGLVYTFVAANFVVANSPDSLCYSRTFKKEDCDEKSWDRLLSITNSLCALDRYDKTEVSKERNPAKDAGIALNFVLDQLKTPEWFSESNADISWNFYCGKK